MTNDGRILEKIRNNAPFDIKFGHENIRSTMCVKITHVHILAYGSIPRIIFLMLFGCCVFFFVISFLNGKIYVYDTMVGML